VPLVQGFHLARPGKPWPTLMDTTTAGPRPASRDTMPGAKAGEQPAGNALQPV